MAIKDIQPDQPTGQDLVSQGDDQLRQFKADVVESFGGIDGAVYEDADKDGTGGTTLVSAATMSSWEARIKALEELALGPESGTISVGMIMFWPDNTNLPAGWVACNGSAYQYTDANGDPQTITTPDLRGRFLCGGSGANGPGAGESGGPAWSDEGQFGPQLNVQAFTGGSHTHSVPGAAHALTVGQMPEHYHFNFRQASGNVATQPVNQQFDTPVWKGDQGSGDNNYVLSDGGAFERANALWGSSVGGNQAHTHPARNSASAGSHGHQVWVTPQYYSGRWIMYIADGTPV